MYWGAKIRKIYRVIIGILIVLAIIFIPIIIIKYTTAQLITI